ncbi:MAG: cytochrome c-type biogenesis protein CcmH, partial [Pseudomonadota bacterium]
AYISARYGDYVLLKPPVKAETLPLWIAPVAFLVVGLGLGAAYLHGRRAVAEGLSEADAAEARAILWRDE